MFEDSGDSQSTASGARAVGDLLHAAAHGEFDTLTHERAGLLEQQTNLMLGRLTELIQVSGT